MNDSDSPGWDGDGGVRCDARRDEILLLMTDRAMVSAKSGSRYTI